MFDPNKAQFTPDELNAAASADAVYEILKGAFGDGLQLEDLATVPAVIPHVTALYAYLAGGTPRDYAEKMIAIGTMLLRDNEFLAGLDGNADA